MEEYTQEQISSFLHQIGIPTIEEDTNYWFLRTSGGANFEDFYFGNYVAIGWDSLNDIELLKTNSHDELKKEIIDAYPEDARPGNTASQIHRFVKDFKVGDYVLIPGTNSDLLAFGKITSDVYVYEPTAEDKIDLLFDEYLDEVGFTFLKRRNVEWLTSKPLKRTEIDPLLIPIIYSYGTIVDANQYSDFINRTLHDVYYRDGSLHSTFEITRKDNIPAFEFHQFISTFFDICDEVNDSIGVIEIDKESLSIKASINSPGPVEIISWGVFAILVMSSVALFLNGAKLNLDFKLPKDVHLHHEIDTPGLIDKLREWQESVNKEKLKKLEDDLRKSQEELKIKKRSDQS